MSLLPSFEAFMDDALHDPRPFAELVGNSVFKLLVVGRGASYFPALQGLEPLPLLTHAPDATLDRPRSSTGARLSLVLHPR
ncbi:hypothetical protein WMF39_10060 [Sorangium sp. So ce1504]|uniref:hypothetical protein n=1 Tax=Sorangium sp. So ce1504 TaxID=3133337 RepID=UPI003F5E7460